MHSKIRPHRKITGYSAVLLPFKQDGSVDGDAFCAHVVRTADAGLIPAVNMDTGYADLIEEHIRTEALRLTAGALSGRPFTAGAFVRSRVEDAFNPSPYYRQIEQILSFGGIPTIFQSFGLTALPSEQIICAYADFGRLAPQFIAFELGTMFAPFGKIYDLATYEELLKIPQCIGAKHSSLSRWSEWERLAVRDRIRPDFKVFTGNDLAIDMVMYGSDYLLGLSTFAPDYFALRDRYWFEGDLRYYELNDVLQYLGFFAFRAPVPAYKHTAAQFLKLRGWISCDNTHARSLKRPAGDIDILQKILEQLERLGK
ncbi:MAG: dihydrodipicolinate synthase family protein [Deltaproteobacteria bacterium]|nr:dihydrodipicolinate synthase family protein [Deltaproteobacteria bacterium]